MSGEPVLYDPAPDTLLVELRPWPAASPAEVNEQHEKKVSAREKGVNEKKVEKGEKGVRNLFERKRWKKEKKVSGTFSNRPGCAGFQAFARPRPLNLFISARKANVCDRRRYGDESTPQG
jgi:hypothetical protein